MINLPRASTPRVWGPRSGRYACSCCFLTLAACEGAADPGGDGSLSDTGSADASGSDETAGTDETAATGEADLPCFDPWLAPEMTYIDGDPRLFDPEYAWSGEIVREHSECRDCHRVDGADGPAAPWIWDADCQPVWTDSATDTDLEGFNRRVLEGDDRIDLDDAGRRRIADLVESELARRADRRDE